MHFQGIIGLIVLAGIAWGISENRRSVSHKDIVIGIVLQLIIAAILLNVPAFEKFFLLLNRLVSSLPV